MRGMGTRTARRTLVTSALFLLALVAVWAPHRWVPPGEAAVALAVLAAVFARAGWLALATVVAAAVSGAARLVTGDLPVDVVVASLGLVTEYALAAILVVRLLAVAVRRDRRVF